MKNTGFTIFVVFMFVAAGAIFFWPHNSGVQKVVSSGDAQEITLSMKDANYYPREIRVKEGEPVSIYLDSSVQGCFRSFTIRDLGVSGISNSPSEAITFTPTKKGSFRFACGMGMGYGTIVVE